MQSRPIRRKRCRFTRSLSSDTASFIRKGEWPTGRKLCASFAVVDRGDKKRNQSTAGKSRQTREHARTGKEKSFGHQKLSLARLYNTVCQKAHTHNVLLNVRCWESGCSEAINWLIRHRTNQFTHAKAGWPLPWKFGPTEFRCWFFDKQLEKRFAQNGKTHTHTHTHTCTRKFALKEKIQPCSWQRGDFIKRTSPTNGVSTQITQDESSESLFLVQKCTDCPNLKVDRMDETKVKARSKQRSEHAPDGPGWKRLAGAKNVKKKDRRALLGKDFVRKLPNGKKINQTAHRSAEKMHLGKKISHAWVWRCRKRAKKWKMHQRGEWKQEPKTWQAVWMANVQIG